MMESRKSDVQQANVVKWTRRDVLRHAAAGSAAWFAIGRAAKAGPTAKVMERRVISWQRNLYHGWPTVARRRNGELLLVCSGGRQAHVCPFGRVELMRSYDEGKHWSWPSVVIDSPLDDRDAGVLETARGTLIVTTFTSLAYLPTLEKAEKQAKEGAGGWDAERLARWQAARDQISARRRRQQLGVWYIRSTDDGVSWSQPRRSIVNSPHGPIQLADGRLLYAGKELWHGAKRVGVCQSADDGQTWTWLAEIPVREGDSPANYHELHAVEAADGTIVVQIRNHNRRNERETLQCESTDGGRTWSVPRAIGVWGLPSHLLRLSDDRLLMTYGYRRKPFGNQARVSTDNGRTWSEPITISDDGAGGDLGYPSTVELSDGSLLSVWYELLAGTRHAVLRQAHWQLDG